MTNPFSAETEYFYKLSPELVLDAVELMNFRTTGRIIALNSLENRVYQVEIEIADSEIKSPYDRYKIAKFYRPGRWTKEQILEEHKMLLLLKEAGLPVIAPKFFNNGQTLQQLTDSGIFFCIYDKYGGRHLAELNDTQLKTLGRTLAMIHNQGTALKSTTRPSLTPKTFGTENINYLLESGLIPTESLATYRSVVEPIITHSAASFQNLNLIRIHGDCHLGNVLWLDEKIMILDFDDMVRGPAVQDLWLINSGRDDESLKRREVLIEAYSELRDFNFSELALIEPLRALRIIHFQGWIARRLQDPAFTRTFPHFGTTSYWREELAALIEISELIGRD